MDFPLEYELELVKNGKSILTLDYDNENRLKKALKIIKKLNLEYTIKKTKRGFHVYILKNGKVFEDEIFKIFCLRALLMDDEFRLLLDYFRYKNGCKKVGILFDKKIYL